MVLVIIGLAYGSMRLIDRIQALRWQAQCANYLLPADSPVYCEDRAQAKRLLAMGTHYSEGLGVAFVTPEPWKQLNPAHSESVVIFLHERTDSTGQKVIVVLRIYVTPTEQGREISFVGATYEPGSLFRQLRSTNVGVINPRMQLDFDDRVTIYSGQPDPSDQSRFTIEYEVNGVHGFLDAQLRPPGLVFVAPRGGSPSEREWYPKGTKLKPPADDRTPTQSG